MRMDEGTDGQTDKTEGYTDSHADGRTFHPSREQAHFATIRRRLRAAFRCTGIRMCTPLLSNMTGVNRPAYWQNDTLVSFLLRDGKNTGV